MAATLREIVIEDLPPALVTRLLERAPWVYREARDQVENGLGLDGPERAYAEPHIRRALFEKVLKEAALDCGLRPTTERVSAGGAQYTAIRAGRILLTGSKTNGREGVPRACGFRGQYSQINEHVSQGELFPVPSAPGEAALYAIITHGPKPGAPGEIGFLRIGFPAEDMSDWADSPIDLTDIQDYQRQRFQKVEDERAAIQTVEPKLKPGLGEVAGKLAEKKDSA